MSDDEDNRLCIADVSDTSMNDHYQFDAVKINNVLNPPSPQPMELGSGPAEASGPAAIAKFPELASAILRADTVIQNPDPAGYPEEEPIDGLIVDVDGTAQQSFSQENPKEDGELDDDEVVDAAFKPREPSIPKQPEAELKFDATTPKSKSKSADITNGRANKGGPSSVGNSPVSTKKANGTVEAPRKRKDNGVIEKELNKDLHSESAKKILKPAKHPNNDITAGGTAPKKAKQVRDVGTCVQARAIQTDREESLFEMDVGASALVQMTVVCKMESNAVYVIAKWKDQELSGILTDGEPPAFNTCMKKRPILSNGLLSLPSGSGGSGGEGSERGGSSSTNSGNSTPMKSRSQAASGTPRDQKRNGRNLLGGSESKRKISCSSKVDQGEEDELDVCGLGNVCNSYRLHEVPERNFTHACSSDGCNHRYETSSELEYHKCTVHGRKAIMREQSSTQTDSSCFRLIDAQTLTDQMKAALPTVATLSQESIQRMLLSTGGLDGVKKETGKTSPSQYSDLTDDDAPELQKEEPAMRPLAAQATPTAAPMTTTAIKQPVMTVGMASPVIKESTSMNTLCVTPTSVKKERATPLTSSSMPTASNIPQAHDSSFHAVERPRTSSAATMLTPTPSAPPVAPSPRVQASPLFMPPMGAGGFASPFHMFHGMPPQATPPQMQRAIASPANASARQAAGGEHKIHELKVKEESSSSSSNAVIASSALTPSSSAKVATSMAQQQQSTPQRAFGVPPMMQQPGASPSLQAQQQHAMAVAAQQQMGAMMQAQMLQAQFMQAAQMQAQQMAASQQHGGRPPFMPGAPGGGQDAAAQYAMIQQVMQQGFMFPNAR